MNPASSIERRGFTVGRALLEEFTSVKVQQGAGVSIDEIYVYWCRELGHELTFRAYAGDVVKVPFSISVQARSIKGHQLEVVG